jgi:protein-S-isoprenylcysteine O-methyltransferase Ste14
MTQIEYSKKTRLQLALRGLLAPVILFGLLFLLAGRLDYWQGWVYLGLTVISLILMSTILTRNPELVEERLNPKQGMKRWDKFYFAVTTPLYLVALVLGGLDARFGWTKDMPWVAYLAGVGVYLIGQAVFLWARYTNNYFSSVVRIQTERGHTVCKDGPYRYVRHPGYVGGFLFTVTVGLVLGSWWASLPQVIAALLIIWRTALEDKTLQSELPGYAEFTKETRYRLVPGIW